MGKNKHPQKKHVPTHKTNVHPAVNEAQGSGSRNPVEETAFNQVMAAMTQGDEQASQLLKTHPDIDVEEGSGLLTLALLHGRNETLKILLSMGCNLRPGISIPFSSTAIMKTLAESGYFLAPNRDQTVSFESIHVDNQSNAAFFILVDKNEPNKIAPISNKEELNDLKVEPSMAQINRLNRSFTEAKIYCSTGLNNPNADLAEWLEEMHTAFSEKFNPTEIINEDEVKSIVFRNGRPTLFLPDELKTSLKSMLSDGQSSNIIVNMSKIFDIFKSKKMKEINIKLALKVLEDFLDCYENYTYYPDERGYLSIAEGWIAYKVLKMILQCVAQLENSSASRKLIHELHDKVSFILSLSIMQLDIPYRLNIIVNNSAYRVEPSALRSVTQLIPNTNINLNQLQLIQNEKEIDMETEKHNMAIYVLFHVAHEKIAALANAYLAEYTRIGVPEKLKNDIRIQYEFSKFTFYLSNKMYDELFDSLKNVPNLLMDHLFKPRQNHKESSKGLMVCQSTFVIREAIISGMPIEKTWALAYLVESLLKTDGFKQFCDTDVNAEWRKDDRAEMVSQYQTFIKELIEPTSTESKPLFILSLSSNAPHIVIAPNKDCDTHKAKELLSFTEGVKLKQASYIINYPGMSLDDIRRVINHLQQFKAIDYPLAKTTTSHYTSAPVKFSYTHQRKFKSSQCIAADTNSDINHNNQSEDNGVVLAEIKKKILTTLQLNPDTELELLDNPTMFDKDRKHLSWYVWLNDIKDEDGNLIPEQLVAIHKKMAVASQMATQAKGKNGLKSCSHIDPNTQVVTRTYKTKHLDKMTRSAHGLRIVAVPVKVLVSEANEEPTYAFVSVFGKGFDHDKEQYPIDLDKLLADARVNNNNNNNTNNNAMKNRA